MHVYAGNYIYGAHVVQQSLQNKVKQVNVRCAHRPAIPSKQNQATRRAHAFGRRILEHGGHLGGPVAGVLENNNNNNNNSNTNNSNNYYYNYIYIYNYNYNSYNYNNIMIIIIIS